MYHEKAPPIRDLLSPIQEIWNHFDKEFCFKLVKSIPERIKAIIKTRRGTTKFSFCL